MPGLQEFEHLAKSYSLAIGLLVISEISLVAAVVHLYRQNARLYDRIGALLEKRVEVLESIVGRQIAR